MDRDSPANAWRAELERVQTARGRHSTARFAVPGWRLLQRGLRAGHPCHAVFVAPSSEDEYDGERRELLAACETRIDVDDATMEQLTAGRGEGAVVGLFPIPQCADDLVTARNARLLVAVDIEDPGNAGALVRTALAAGASGFVAVGATDPFHPRAVRISRGSIFRLPVLRMSEASGLFVEGLQQLATTPAGETDLASVSPATAPWALWVGRESRGLDEKLLERADRRVAIPMGDGVDSYSVNAAAAIALHGLLRGV